MSLASPSRSWTTFHGRVAINFLLERLTKHDSAMGHAFSNVLNIIFPCLETHKNTCSLSGNLLDTLTTVKGSN